MTKTTGTFFLDGLLEGHLGKTQDSSKQCLADWVAITKDLGLKFSMDIEGSTFNIMPETILLDVNILGDPDLSGKLEKLIQELVDQYTKTGGDQLFSTLRSTEYKKQEEHQSLYVISGQNVVSCEQRIVPATTVEKIDPDLIKKNTIKSLVSGLILSILFLGVSSFFVDYSSLFSNIKEQISAPNPENLVVENHIFTDYFRVTDKQLSKDKKDILITIETLNKEPLSEGMILNKLNHKQEYSSIQDFLNIQNLALGEITVKLFNKKIELLATATISINQLKKVDHITLKIPIVKHLAVIVFDN